MALDLSAFGTKGTSSGTSSGLNLSAFGKVSPVVPAKSYFQGNGYGASNVLDVSGRPLLTYENQTAKSSQLLSDRTATTFDPTIPQKLTPEMLQNGRMPANASEAIKTQLGGNSSQELDHQIALELGGSNNPSNLKLEALVPGTKNTATDSLENQLAKQVVNGDKTGLSYFDAQKQLAAAKGYALPEEGGKVPTAGQFPISVPPLSFEQKAGAIATHFFPSTLQTLSELQLDPLSLKADPRQALTDRAKSIYTTIAGEGQNIKNIFTEPTIAGKVGAGLQSLAGVVNVALSPITSLFTAANDIPVLGSLSRLIGVAFGVLGETGHVEAKAIVDKIPGLSPDAKTKIADGFGAILGLANQFAVGGITEELARAKLEPRFGSVDTQTIIDKAKTVAEGKDIMAKPIVPETKPVTSPELVQKVKSDAELASELANTKKEISTTSPVKPSEIIPPPKMLVTDEIGNVQKSKPAGALRPIEGIGETKTRGLSQDVEAKAVSAKLTDTFGDLPEYKTMNVADQGTKAIDLVQKDSETAKQIAYGAKAPPKGLTPEAVFVAVEQDALERGDVQTLKELANSRLTTEATTMGQRIRMLAERNPESPSEAIRAVQEARVKAVQARLGKQDISTAQSDIVKEAKQVIQKTRSPVSDWKSFVESIQC
jgi:hypothetical protein